MGNQVTILSLRLPLIYRVGDWMRKRVMTGLSAKGQRLVSANRLKAFQS